MNRIPVLFTFALALILTGCKSEPGSTSGIAAGFSYSALWDFKDPSFEGLKLLIISDYTDENSPAKGQRLFGSSLKPWSGYHDHDGEVVTFSVTENGHILILDKYLPIGETPAIFHVFRDSNGLLDVKPVSLNDENYQAVFAEIKSHQE